MSLLAVFVCVSMDVFVLADVRGPFSDHFMDYLRQDPEKNAYILSAYDRYGASGSFGGKAHEAEEVIRQPVLFIHGNADSALFHAELTATGWDASIATFKNDGYKNGELYGLTYGERDIMKAANTRLNCAELMGFRRLAEAVLNYTKADKIDIIGHSMGVTIGRKIVKGGKAKLSGEECDLGAPLSEKVDAFIGLAGANYGMCMCLHIANASSCDSSDGYFPGVCGSKDKMQCSEANEDCVQDSYGSFLKAINDDERKEGTFVGSFWGANDQVLGLNNLVWGRRTSVIPQSDHFEELPEYNHFTVKSHTPEIQLHLVSRHSLPEMKKAGKHHAHVHHKLRHTRHIPLVI